MKSALQLALLFAAACGPAPDDRDPPISPAPDPEPVWIDTRAVDDEPPALLSEIGLYGDAAEREDVHPDAVSYEPTYPLWSNGLTKSRHLVLPEGATVSAGDAWDFPEGTLFFKTFEDDDGPVETRLMWRSGSEWKWSTYVWNDAHTDAERTEGRRSVEIEVNVGAETFVHRAPNEIDCRKCHEPDPNGVLGFEPLQLGETIDNVAAIFDEPPVARSIEAEDDATRAILGWFVGNCTSCHNGLAAHEQSSFDLTPDVALANTIGRETESSASVDGIRIVPGDPAASVLYRAVAGDDDDRELKEMPPVGVQRRDQAAIERLREWIEGLR